MTTMSDAVKVQHQEYIKASMELGDLTPQEAIELGIWLTGKGMGASWGQAMKSAGLDDAIDDSAGPSDDPQSPPK